MWFFVVFLFWVGFLVGFNFCANKNGKVCYFLFLLVFVVLFIFSLGIVMFNSFYFLFFYYYYSYD